MLTILRGGSCRQTSCLPVYQTLGGEDVVDNLYCNTAVAKDETPDYITAMHTKTGALLQYTQAHPYIMSQTLTTDCTKARHEKLLSCTILCNRTEGCSVRRANKMSSVDIWAIRGEKTHWDSLECQSITLLAPSRWKPGIYSAWFESCLNSVAHNIRLVFRLL